MGQGVHCGVDGIALRQTEGQGGIEDGGKRDGLRVEDLALAVGLGLADDGGDGGLAAGTGGGGHGDEQQGLLFYLQEMCIRDRVCTTSVAA